MLGGFHLKNAIYSLMWPVFKLGDTVRHHPIHVLQKRVLEETVDYIQANMREAIGMPSQKKVIAFGARQGLKVLGCFCEFGVYKGETLRFIGDIAGADRAVHGFDSFEGLPAGWSGHDMEKGTFDVGGRLPKVRSNTRLHKGLFNDTIPPFKASTTEPIAFMHVDCDIYTSTATILSLLGDRIQPGTIIVFDEYFNYPSWRDHEFKAFQEFIVERQIRFSYLAYAKYNVCVRIDSMG